MSCLSFFHLFSDFLLKNRAKFDTFSLIFEFQPPLLIRFSDIEIPLVQRWNLQSSHATVICQVLCSDTFLHLSRGLVKVTRIQEALDQ